MMCATLLGNVSIAGGGAASAVAVRVSTETESATRPSLSVGGAMPVRFSHERVSGSSCNSYWNTCNATSSSPACLQLYQAALHNVVLCSNDPQYLTVSSSTTSLDFAYTVRGRVADDVVWCMRVLTASMGD